MGQFIFSTYLIAPFVYPEVEWDFRLPQIKSINVSNHKFGLVYPGIGSIIFRDITDLPDELIFHINYLGGDMPNYSLNFSRSSSIILLQYYNFIRFGKKGYQDIMKNIMFNACYLEKCLLSTGRFELLNESKYLPVVVVKLKNSHKFTVFELAETLRRRGWIVPAYPLPANAEDIAVLRMVVKENFSRDMAKMLVKDMQWALQNLDANPHISKSKYSKSPHRIC